MKHFYIFFLIYFSKNAQGLECFYCDSIADTEVCTEVEEGVTRTETCTDPSEVCHSLIDTNGITRRGCSFHFATFSSVEEQTCDSDFCNLKTIQLSCVQCGSDNPNCYSDVDDVQPCKVDNQVSCYTDITAGYVRGCTADDYPQCKDNGCEVCLGSGCNCKIYHSCYDCNDDDVECGRPGSNQCHTEYARCFYCRNEANLTQSQRGCEPLSDPADCERCEGDSCNARIFCHQCGGEDCEKPPLISAAPCTNFANENKCFLYYNDTGQMNRGCTADLEEYVKCQEYGELCKTTSEKENGDGLLLDFACYNCDDDERCAWRQSGNGESCKYFYYETPTCFTEFNNVTKEVTRGCGNSGKQCSPSENCEYCNEDACNIVEKVKQICLQCDSSKEGQEDCASNSPNEIIGAECPNVDSALYGETCYTKFNENTVTRGCAADLDRANDVCFKGDTESCVQCTDANCNNGPPPGTECFDCTSDEDSNCAKLESTASLQTKICHASKECVTTVKNGLTVRGCPNEFDPCEIDDENCQKCVGSLCNNYPLSKDRIQCYQCTGENCETPLLISPAPCTNFANENKCFLYYNDTGQMNRGCTADLEEYVKCQEYGELCKTTSEKENGDGLLLDFSCYNCDDDERCAWRQSGNGESCKYFYYETPTCFTEFNNVTKEVTRGCGNSGKQCSPSENCEYCNEDACNIVEKVKQICLQCDSSKEGQEDCASNSPKEIIGAECPNVGSALYGETCYTKFNENTVTRGCAADLDRANDVCFKGDTESCVQCTDANCNNGPPPGTECFDCTSDEDSNCAKLESTASLQTKICHASKECVTTVKNGLTVRGCPNEFDPCEIDDENCQKCVGSLCNNYQLSKDRIQCHQCSNSDDCDQTQSLKAPQVCSESSPGQKCFAYYDNQTKHIVRGCSSDKSFSGCVDHCQMFITNGGNDFALEKPFQCFQCDGEEYCGWSLTNDNISSCHLLYFSEPSCYTYQNLKKVSRGCVQNYEFCQTDPQNCEICYTENCNSDRFFSQQCLVCDSSSDADCKSPEKVESTTCTATEQIYSTRGCFTIFEDDGSVKRGCTAELNSEELKSCQNCVFCKENGCNIGSSAQIYFLNSILMLIVLFLLKWV